MIPNILYGSLGLLGAIPEQRARSKLTTAGYGPKRKTKNKVP